MNTFDRVLETMNNFISHAFANLLRGELHSFLSKNNSKSKKNKNKNKKKQKQKKNMENKLVQIQLALLALLFFKKNSNG